MHPKIQGGVPDKKWTVPYITLHITRRKRREGWTETVKHNLEMPLSNYLHFTNKYFQQYKVSDYVSYVSLAAPNLKVVGHVLIHDSRSRNHQSSKRHKWIIGLRLCLHGHHIYTACYNYKGGFPCCLSGRYSCTIRWYVAELSNIYWMILWVVFLFSVLYFQFGFQGALFFSVWGFRGRIFWFSVWKCFIYRF